jgi:hypothetical protein
MDQLGVETRDGNTSFRPGEVVEGRATWQLDEEPKSVELRLFWYTSGKGDRDVGVAESVVFEEPGASRLQPFQFRLPDGPYSFSGKLITLTWAIEIIAEPGGRCESLEITVSPTGEEIRL